MERWCAEFVAGDPLTPELMRADPAIASRAAATLGRLHGSSLTFRRRFDPFAAIGAMVASLDDRRVTAMRRALENVRVELSVATAPRRPCHNDPWPGNLVDTGASMVLVDWDVRA